MKRLRTVISALVALALWAPVSAPAAPQSLAPLGSDAPACMAGDAPAILVNIVGLKDRRGGLKLELYPGNQADFLKDDRDLVRAGKFFRRVRASVPQSGPVAMCIRADRPGRYALLVTHDRDGKNKFNFWTDGAGFVGAQRLGRTRPKLEMAAIDLGPKVTTVTVRMQYLHGLSGFGPMKD